jgi:hypothetical protein
MATACSSLKPSSLSRWTNLSVSKWWSFCWEEVLENARRAGLKAATYTPLCRIGPELGGSGWTKRRGRLGGRAVDEGFVVGIGAVLGVLVVVCMERGLDAGLNEARVDCCGIEGRLRTACGAAWTNEEEVVQVSRGRRNRCTATGFELAMDAMVSECSTV